MFNKVVRLLKHPAEFDYFALLRRILLALNNCLLGLRLTSIFDHQLLVLKYFFGPMMNILFDRGL